MDWTSFLTEVLRFLAVVTSVGGGGYLLLDRRTKKEKEDRDDKEETGEIPIYSMSELGDAAIAETVRKIAQTWQKSAQDLAQQLAESNDRFDDTVTELNKTIHSQQEELIRQNLRITHQSSRIQALEETSEAWPIYIQKLYSHINNRTPPPPPFPPDILLPSLLDDKGDWVGEIKGRYGVR